MPRFTVKDVLRATALISIGAGLWSLRVWNSEAEMKDGEPLAHATAILIGAALVGAGVLTPFKRPWLGAAIGFLAVIGVVAVYFVRALT